MKTSTRIYIAFVCLCIAFETLVLFSKCLSAQDEYGGYGVYGHLVIFVYGELPLTLFGWLAASLYAIDTESWRNSLKQIKRPTLWLVIHILVWVLSFGTNVILTRKNMDSRKTAIFVCLASVWAGKPQNEITICKKSP